MDVKPGVTLWNVCGMILVIGNDMIAVTYLFFSAVYFLQSPAYYNLGTEESAATVSNLLFYSTPFAIFFDLISGFFYTAFGRRWVIFIGCMILALTIYVIPYLPHNSVYPDLLIALYFTFP